MIEPSPRPSAADLYAIAGRFALDAPVDTVGPFGDGLINATFLVAAGATRSVLQRLNAHVFPWPERIMANLAVLTGHLAGRAEAGLRIPALVPAADGAPFVRDAQGDVWRLLELIPNACVLPRIETPTQAREVGRALGRFHRLVADLAPDRLAVTLPGFHVTPAYLQRLLAVLDSTADRHDEAVRHAVAFVAARQAGAGVLEAAHREGRTPSRVIHGDPKLDNILFDRAGGLAVALIDLDTVQPGLIHYDIGDCLRSCCNRGGESPDGAPRAAFDLDTCGGILGAYAEETRPFLTESDIALIYEAIRLIPFELGLRFLTDHLEGDRYFRVTERGQNLRKAEVQFALTGDIERQGHAIRRIIADCFAGP